MHSGVVRRGILAAGAGEVNGGEYPQEAELRTVPDAGRALAVSPRLVVRWVAAGRIPTAIGGHQLIRRPEVDVPVDPLPEEDE